uniref:Uncharacterized protein n=1 Tax=Romanomermis culicivorax TaxID=13658 RepID=A0A915LD42_ROMCU
MLAGFKMPNERISRERIPQDQERFHQPERAPELSNQELVTQLGELKGTVEALFNIITHAATEDNKREAD